MDENKKVIHLGRSPEEEVPDFYVNQAAVTTNVYEVLLQLGLKTDPQEEAKPIVNIRMSPQHAKVLTQLLRTQLRNYEKDIGEIRIPADMTKDMGIDGGL